MVVTTINCGWSWLKPRLIIKAVHRESYVLFGSRWDRMWYNLLFGFNFIPNFGPLVQLLKILEIHFWDGGDRVWYHRVWCSRGIQVSFTPNFRILTQLLKILEFCHADLNFKFSLFSKTKNFINLTFFTYIRIPGRRLYRKKIESCRWEIFEKLVKDSTTLYLDFFLHIIKIQTIKYVASEQRWS